VARKFGLFGQPKSPALKQMRPTAPWAFDPSNADQRAAPSAAAGDYYGTGHKNPLGRLRDDTVGYRPVSQKEMGTPPKSIV
jgi:hypothetical protein